MYTTTTTTSLGALLGAPPPRPNRTQSGRITKPRLRFARLRASAANDEEPQPQRSEEVDWDRAWKATIEKKQQKRGRPLFDLNMEQYVSRKPVYRDFPASEETDQFRRIERSNLRAWSDPKFTIAGFGVILGLFVYMVMNAPPPHA